MKKWLSLFLALAMLLGAVPAGAEAPAAASGQTLPTLATEENRETEMTRADFAQALAPLFGYAAE